MSLFIFFVLLVGGVASGIKAPFESPMFFSCVASVCLVLAILIVLTSKSNNPEILLYFLVLAGGCVYFTAAAVTVYFFDSESGAAVTLGYEVGYQIAGFDEVGRKLILFV